MIKRVKQTFGKVIALGVVGDTEAEVEQELNALYNFNCWGRLRPSQMDTRAEQEDTAQVVYENFQYVWTDEKRLRRALLARTHNRLLNDCESGKIQIKKKDIQPLVNSEFQQTLENIKTETFLGGSTELEKRRGRSEQSAEDRKKAKMEILELRNGASVD